MTTVKSFVERLRKIGVEVAPLASNYPWVYLTTVNGKRVTETYAGEHGFTVFFTAIKNGEADKITDIPLIFKTIRKYLTPKTTKQFNRKYKDYLEKGHYGLSLGTEEFIAWLDKQFLEFIKIPNFKYSQIKEKFGGGRFYCTGLTSDQIYLIENKITELC